MPGSRLYTHEIKTRMYKSGPREYRGIEFLFTLLIFDFSSF